MTRPALSVAAAAGGLVVEGLRKSYRRRTVIRDVTLHLDRGEVVALLGPNGSGKTTCFYSIAGLVGVPFVEWVHTLIVPHHGWSTYWLFLTGINLIAMTVFALGYRGLPKSDED